MLGYVLYTQNGPMICDVSILCMYMCLYDFGVGFDGGTLQGGVPKY